MSMDVINSDLSRRERFTIGVLCFVNVINYMDRYGVAGLLVNIQQHYEIGDDLGGLLQTGFIVAYMLCSPLFGYLGDRYSRQLLLIICIVTWTTMTICGSFAPNYGIFFATRACVGVGEAGFSVVAPTVLSDIVSSDARSLVLALFYLAIPVGSGLGYVVSAKVAEWTNEWRWGLRATPALGILGMALMFLTENPLRGAKEAEALGGKPTETTSYCDDLRYLFHNPSFLLSTGAFTCVSFIAGALGWWAPKCLYLGFMQIEEKDDVVLGDVVFKFGAITALTGLLGVVLGSALSKKLRPKFPRVDPLICGLGLFVSLPFLVLALYICSEIIWVTFTLVFFGQIALNLNWAVVADILLYVVIPTRRSTAEAVQMLISHALGDSCSPYIVGLLSEYFKDSCVDAQSQLFYALQTSLLIIMIVELIGGVFFIWTSVYVVRDKENADKLLVVY